jgi:hypothetical protein
MSKKTLEDSASQHERTAKTPDLIEFTTADKLTEDTTEVTQRTANHHKDTINSSRGRHTNKSEPPNNSNPPKKQRKGSDKHTKNTKNREQPRDTTPTKNSRLSIITLLKSGLRPSKICVKLGITDSTLQYHLNILKKQGAIHKVGYGVWEVLDQQEITKKRTARTPYVAKEHVVSEVQKKGESITQDSVRAHAFTFTLQISPDLRNWTNEKREYFLESKEIPYKSLGIIGGGQRLIIEGRKTWLTNKSVVIYDTGSYFAEKAIEAKSEAVQSFLSIVKKLERLLHVELTIGNDYKFKVSRQHYALMKNALAKQYNSEGKILEVRSEGDNSLWFLIDNSFNLYEAETVHPDTAMPDNQKMQNFFNGVKNTGITPEFILEAMNGIQGNQAVFAENTESHIEAIRDLSKGTNEFSEAAKELLKLLKDVSSQNNQGSVFEIIKL